MYGGVRGKGVRCIRRCRQRAGLGESLIGSAVKCGGKWTGRHMLCGVVVLRQGNTLGIAYPLFGLYFLAYLSTIAMLGSGSNSMKRKYGRCSAAEVS